jgi:hypothetical protein
MKGRFDFAFSEFSQTPDDDCIRSEAINLYGDVHVLFRIWLIVRVHSRHPIRPRIL